MNNIFENAFVSDRRKTELIPLIMEELSVLPSAILNFCFEHGGKIYLPTANDTLFFVRNGLEISVSEDGRSSTDTSHVYYRKDRDEFVLIYDTMDFLKNGHPHSVSLHEFFHLIEFTFYRLRPRRSYELLSSRLPRGIPLDWYAALNKHEKFAVAGEAFCHPEGFVSNDYRTHNKLELFQKCPEIFRFFEQLFINWERGIF